jgi:hypothetical protein
VDVVGILGPHHRDCGPRRAARFDSRQRRR